MAGINAAVFAPVVVSDKNTKYARQCILCLKTRQRFKFVQKLLRGRYYLYLLA